MLGTQETWLRSPSPGCSSSWDAKLNVLHDLKTTYPSLSSPNRLPLTSQLRGLQGKPAWRQAGVRPGLCGLSQSLDFNPSTIAQLSHTRSVLGSALNTLTRINSLKSHSSLSWGPRREEQRLNGLLRSP